MFESLSKGGDSDAGLKNKLKNQNKVDQAFIKIKRGLDSEWNSFYDHIIWAEPNAEIGLGKGLRGIQFNPDVTNAFIRRNNLCFFIRGHTYQEKGYSIDHDDKLITLSSSPYDGDKGGILKMNVKKWEDMLHVMRETLTFLPFVVLVRKSLNMLFISFSVVKCSLHSPFLIF